MWSVIMNLLTFKTTFIRTAADEEEECYMYEQN